MQKFSRRVRWRFQRRITKDPSGCWLWTGSITRGYGRICIKRKQYLAHRVAWYLFIGEGIPSGLVVHHTCGVKRCVNPDHLELMTPEAHSAHHMSNAL